MGLSFCFPIHADTLRSDRALVAVVDLHQMTSKTGFYQWAYQREEAGAARLIERYSNQAYAQTEILTGDRASFEDFKLALNRFVQDPRVRAIDVILYLHGHSARDYPEPEICFVSPDRHCLPTRRLKEELKGFSKLRMLYSDACHGSEQMQDWLDAGFRAVDGSKDVDTNFYSDLKRFLKAWIHGEAYSRAIDFANQGRVGRSLDQLLGGVSFKLMDGDPSLRIGDD